MPFITQDEKRDLHLKAMLAGTSRRLGLLKRIPELMRTRGWGHDEDLVSVFAAAVACKVLGAGAQVFRRPAKVDGIDRIWPVEWGRLTASQIVSGFELKHLLVQ